MGSHKQHKKYKRDASSSESESSSSEEERISKRKPSKKSKRSTSVESDSETEKKPRHVSSSEEKSKIRKSELTALGQSDRRHKDKIQYEEKRNKHTERRDETTDGRDRSGSWNQEVDDIRQQKDYHKHDDRERRVYDRRDKRNESREKNDDNRDKREVDRVRHEDRYRSRGVEDRNSGKYINENYRRGKDDGRDRRHEKRRRRSGSFDHANAKWGKDGDNIKTDKTDNEKKDKPNFGLSGKLTEERNTFRGVVIKYSEPPEARKPRRRWRLYPFKGEKALQTLYIHRESAYLIGRERKVVDLPIDHPSCSKQHAALQYRLVPFTREDGSVGKRVRPYLIDLESANGTFINNKKIEPKKYVELLERDVIKFGFSSREYVLLHENSKDEALDDDVKQEDEEEVKVKKERPE